MLGSIGPTELILIGLIFLLIPVMLLPKIFYILTLQKALSRCSPENRMISPGLVWLLLIPLFELVWHFIVVRRIADSLGLEYKRRNLMIEPNPGRDLGTVMCIMNACGLFPLLGIFATVAGIICWIMYWVKISDYSRRLDIRSPGEG